MLRPCVVTCENLADFRPLLAPELTDAESLFLLGLEEDGSPRGLLAGVPGKDAFEIRSLCVAADHRRRGGGLRLLEVLLSILEEEPDVKTVRCGWTATPETEGLLPLFLTAGFVSVAAEDGCVAVELALTPTEDLGYLLSGMDEN